MTVKTRTDWVTREEFQALAKQVAKLEGQVGESDKRLVTWEDVQSEIAGLRSEIRLFAYVLSIVLVLLLALFGDITLSDVLRLLLRLGGG